MAGASAVQVGTAGMVDPGAPLEIISGIERFMKREGVADIAGLIGVAKAP